MDVKAVPRDAPGAGTPVFGRGSKAHFQIEDEYIGLRAGHL